MWDLEVGQIYRTFRGHAGGIGAVAVSADGKLIASGGHDHKIRLWQADTGKLSHTLKGHTDWISSLAFHPDGRLLVSRCHEQPFCFIWPLDVESRQCPYSAGQPSTG